MTKVRPPAGIVYSLLTYRTLIIKRLGCTTLCERRSNLYPFFVLPFSFSVNGTEGGWKEAVKCAPLVLPGDTIADPRDFPSSLKDGAYYCYCAYVLRISRYSDFLSPMLTNTGIFLCGLKLSGESRC